MFVHVYTHILQNFTNQPIKSHRLSVGVPRCPRSHHVSPCLTMSHLCRCEFGFQLVSQILRLGLGLESVLCSQERHQLPGTARWMARFGLWPLSDTRHLEATNINKPVQSHLNHLNPQNMHRDSKTATCCPPTAMANLPRSSKIFQDLPSIWLATRSFSRNVPKASVACECQPSPNVTRCHQMSPAFSGSRWEDDRAFSRP